MIRDEIKKIYGKRWLLTPEDLFIMHETKAVRYHLINLLDLGPHLSLRPIE